MNVHTESSVTSSARLVNTHWSDLKFESPRAESDISEVGPQHAAYLWRTHESRGGFGHVEAPGDIIQDQGNTIISELIFVS